MWWRPQPMVQLEPLGISMYKGDLIILPFSVSGDFCRRTWGNQKMGEISCLEFYTIMRKNVHPTGSLSKNPEFLNISSSFFFFFFCLVELYPSWELLAVFLTVMSKEALLSIMPVPTRPLLCHYGRGITVSSTGIFISVLGLVTKLQGP